MKPLIITCLALGLTFLTVPASGQVTTEETPENVQKSGELLEVKGQTIKYQRSEDKETDTITVSADAQIMLNSKPSNLEELQKGDKLNIKVTEAAPDLALEVRAARVIKDTPPSPPSPVVRTQPMPRNQPMPQEQPQPAPQPMYAALGLLLTDSPGQGIMVVEVQDQSPAEQGGILTADFIMMINRVAIVTPEEYLKTIAQFAPGDMVEVVVWRQGETVKGNFTAATYPIEDRIVKDPRLALQSALTNQPQTRDWGVQVTQDRQGIRVTGVTPGSPAAAAGIRPGDYIRGVQGTPINSMDAWNAALLGSAALDSVPFNVMRDNQLFDGNMDFSGNGANTGANQGTNQQNANPNPIRPTNPNQNSAIPPGENNPGAIRPTNPNQNSAQQPGTNPGAIRPTNPNRNSAIPPGENNPGAIRPTNPNRNSALPNNPNTQDPTPTTGQNPGSTTQPRGSFSNPNAGTLPGPGANPMNVP